MHKNHQNGFAHGLLVIFAAILLVGLLSFVFWSGFVKNQSPDNESEKDSRELKNFVSTTGSGLAFTYPATWSLSSSLDSGARSDRETNIHLLTSQPMSTVDSKPQVASDSMCVTITELKGNHSFQSKVSEAYLSIEDSMVGSGKVSLVALEGDIDSSEMRLASTSPVSKHGSYYITLKNDYYLVAAAQANCYLSDNPVKRDIANDILEAKSILKSARIVDE